jgi:hypothetical protein
MDGAEIEWLSHDSPVPEDQPSRPRVHLSRRMALLVTASLVALVSVGVVVELSHGGNAPARTLSHELVGTPQIGVNPLYSTISGTATPCIGVAPHQSLPPEPLVTVSKPGPDHVTHLVATSKDLPYPWKFSFTVPPGRYLVAAPGDNAVHVSVDKGQTVTVALTSGCK